MLLGNAARRYVAALALAALLASCSFDYSDGEVGSDADAAIPQVEILGARMVVERSNRLELTADRVASFPEEGYQEFNGVQFREYGPEGELRLEGGAERATLYLETEDIELAGRIQFYSTVEQTRLESEFLYWDSESRELSSGDREPVLMERDDGSRVQGRGVTVDGRRSSVTFTDGVQGSFRSDDDADAELTR